jgi:hypothetical protein
MGTELSELPPVLRYPNLDTDPAIPVPVGAPDFRGAPGTREQRTILGSPYQDDGIREAGGRVQWN